MTFALVGRCEKTGMFGTAVASSSPAVAARCSFVRAGVGAVSSQNITDPALGGRALALMQAGASAAEAVDTLRRDCRDMAYRQLLAVDGQGGTAVFSGANVLGEWAEAQGRDAAAAGNLLADRNVVAAMLDGFLHNAAAHLGDRLMAALAAALAAGGEAGPVRSAGMKIAHETEWPYVDLRCDWSDDCPIKALSHIWGIYKPQMDDYIQRARQPALAPNFNVPGDEKRKAEQ